MKAEGNDFALHPCVLNFFSTLLNTTIILIKTADVMVLCVSADEDAVQRKSV